MGFGKCFCNAIDKANPTLDNGKPPIQTFVSGQQKPLDFGLGGIMIINAQSCKGLEFDIAILANIDQHKPKQDIHTLKSRFYVMVARGREQVILLRTGNICPSPWKVCFPLTRPFSSGKSNEHDKLKEKKYFESPANMVFGH